MDWVNRVLRILNGVSFFQIFPMLVVEFSLGVMRATFTQQSERRKS